MHWCSTGLCQQPSPPLSISSFLFLSLPPLTLPPLSLGQRALWRSLALYPITIKEVIFLYTAACRWGSDGLWGFSLCWAAHGLTLVWGECPHTRLFSGEWHGGAAQNSLASQGWEACAQRGFHEFSIDVEVLHRSLSLFFSVSLRSWSTPEFPMLFSDPSLAFKHQFACVCLCLCVRVSHVC